MSDDLEVDELSPIVHGLRSELREVIRKGIDDLRAKMEKDGSISSEAICAFTVGAVIELACFCDEAGNAGPPDFAPVFKKAMQDAFTAVSNGGEELEALVAVYKALVLEGREEALQ